MTGDEIVVTGISGIFPNCSSVHEFMENLFNKVDMVSVDSKWNLTDPEVPKHSGSVKGMEKFDYQFFKVGYQLAKAVEPMSRKLMEHAYGAIFDSGNTHATLKGKVGVFIGSSYADFSSKTMSDKCSQSDFVVNGSSKAMIANRISYWLDGKGPSYCLDYSCVSSTAALEHAFNSIQSGECDAAVVGASNLCSIPELTLNLKRAGLLCLDGKTKCFDKNGDGCVRSDAVNVIFLQKAKYAKRVYAEVYHTEGAYKLKGTDQFLPFRKSEQLQDFLIEAYSKTDIEPKDVEYVEANGAASAEADTNEVEAIAHVFAGNKAIKIGCVKSNMGNSEPASGLCALTKLCLSYHKGQVPANLHLKEPVQTVKDGIVQIVTENTDFDRGYTAFNNFSLTGANYHVILKGHYIEKNLEKYNCNIPRIVVASGRQESCVSRILDDLKSKQVDAEEIALLHNIFERDIFGHTGRGYIILDTIKESTVAVSESIEHYPGVKPELWFVFSGMGSQWIGMGADLMRIPTFAAAIQRCHKILQPKGIDLVKVITDLDDKTFDNVVHTFVGIGAMQIGLTDILKELGMVPDFIIGHSLGEAGCAYQDESITAEQMILSVYSRGKAAQEASLVKGSMAAVGVGYKNLVNQCPPEIDIACRNSSESCTVSGPVDDMKAFIEDLTKRDIFARVVPTANIAYHSRYVADVGPKLLKYLKEIIKSPKLRSDKWISTSVPRGQWDAPVAKYSSAEYHTNNLLNPVLFEEVIGLIPDNAVVVEVAPHGILQAILKRSLKNCTHVPLTRRGNTDGVKFLLEAIGKLYLAGFNPKVGVLYPTVKFPVSTETPLLSHLVEWEHSETWPLIKNKQNDKNTFSSRNIVFSIHDDDYAYLEGYFRNGVNVLPEAAVLAFVWETLAVYQGTDFRDLSVYFKDIQFHSEVIITAEAPIRLTVMIGRGTNNFEVTQDDELIVSGMVRGANSFKLQDCITEAHEGCDEFEDDIKLTAQDIYKYMKMRGFDCRGVFQSIVSSNVDRTKALIQWNEHWIPFLDSLIQLSSISRDFKGISKPKFIRNLKISIPDHAKENYEIVNGFKCYDANLNNTFGLLRCAGVQINDIIYTDIPIIEDTADILESQVFFPFLPTEAAEMNTALEVNLQIIAENSKFKDILITKVVNDTIPKEFDYIDEVVDNVILVNTEIRTLRFDSDEFRTEIETKEENQTNVILVENLLQDAKIMENLQNVPRDTFILSLEDKVPKTQNVRDFFTILSCMSDCAKIFVLMKRPDHYRRKTSYIPIRFDDTFSWIPDVYNKLATTDRVVLISERQPYCGALGLLKNLETTDHNNVSIFVIDDFNAPKFDPENNLYKEQLQKNMTINILKKGQWGSFYYKSVKMTRKLKSFALKTLVPGDFESVAWVEAPKISGEKTLAQVCYSGLINNVDNNKSDISQLGMDFSGIDKNGDRVMGLIAGGSASSSVEADPDLLWPVPDRWTLEDAATVPLAFVQAYYSLTIRSNFSEGKSVLICDATSSVGQAMISFCLSFKCTIFAVVDSEDKSNTLLRLYPQLNEKNIICSDNDSFFNSLMLDTKGMGCDFVINFARGPCREAAAKCVGFFGCFLDFSKDDMHKNATIGMYFLTKSRSYKTVDVLNIFRPEYSRDRKVLQKLIAQGIENGIVKPLSRVVFSPLQLSKAFIISSANKHTGKVLIRVKDPSISNGLEIIPRISYSAQDVLIIICDEKGIGLELADKLIERGARKIVLHMNKSSIMGYFQIKLQTWNNQEVSVKLSSDNLQTDNKCETFIKNAMKFGTVKGIFVVLDPKYTDNEIKEDFIDSFKKKAVTVMNLDVASRNCSNLCYFVVLSRFSQSSSAEYALSLTEKVCNARNEMGLPALLVRYESIVKMDDQSNMPKTKPQSLSAIFNVIETSLKQKLTNVLTFNSKKEDKTTQEDQKEAEHENGMYSLFKHVDAEEYDVTAQTVVELPTSLNSSINADWDPKDPYIILLPGFEGRPQIFELLAERLKMRAISIRFGPDMQGESIEQIAYNARQELKKRFGEKFSSVNLENKKFYIMGYSFGVNIALELAFLLEKEGKTGIVHCIDSSPDALRVTLDAVLGKVSENQRQDDILNHMFNLLTEKKGNQLQEDLKNIATFDVKVYECLKKMKHIKLSGQYKKLVLESAYSRILMAQMYKPQFKLRSQLVLMKSSKNLMAIELADDYNLSQYSIQPVKVHPLLAADMAKIPYDCRISNIVNMFVDRTVDELKKKDLSNMYTSEISV